MLHGRCGKAVVGELEVEETPILGCYIVRFPNHIDTRGYFQRKYCESSFTSQGLNSIWPQCNVSLNHKKATFRGFHYQETPYEEIKLVTCIKGRIQDAIFDVRINSSTFGKCFSVELSEEENVSLYVAKGVAHGYLTLEDNSVVLYHVSSNYSKEKTRGLSVHDPNIKIKWTIKPEIISEIDLTWPPLLTSNKV
jgi:dTDP-4-dehydrorhamnose 3,5-epimerase